MTVKCFRDDGQVYPALCKYRNFDVIVTIGKGQWPTLEDTNYEVKRRWLHYDQVEPHIGNHVYRCFTLLNSGDLKRAHPLLTVFTPCYKSGERFRRAFDSMRAQTFNNWEWVIIDDSDDGDETYKMLKEYHDRDFRIRLYRPQAHSGRIGNVKYQCCALVNPESLALVELDHDDELHVKCLERVANTFLRYPDCGFCYGDFAEIWSDGANKEYNLPFAYGYGCYRTEQYRCREFSVCNQPPINSKTLRHLVGLPNHIRAWRRDIYFAIGGHCTRWGIADDFDLLLRTFLHTALYYIPHLTYIQYFERGGAGNFQFLMNKDIQRACQMIVNAYDKRLHARFEELGVPDWCWDEAGHSNLAADNPTADPMSPDHPVHRVSLVP